MNWNIVASRTLKICPYAKKKKKRFVCKANYVELKKKKNRMGKREIKIISLGSMKINPFLLRNWTLFNAK